MNPNITIAAGMAVGGLAGGIVGYRLFPKHPVLGAIGGSAAGAMGGFVFSELLLHAKSRLEGELGSKTLPELNSESSEPSEFLQEINDAATVGAVVVGVYVHATREIDEKGCDDAGDINEFQPQCQSLLVRFFEQATP